MDKPSIVQILFPFRKGANILYLIVSLLNIVYGAMLLLSINSQTPGATLILFIGTILSILGLVGFGLFIWKITVSIKEQPKMADRAIKEWWQIARGVDILLIFGLLFRFFVLQPFVVEGNSMEPNYHDNEYLLVNQLSYHIRAPQRGETIIFHYPPDPTQDYIKRIIGLPGETVEIQNGKVLINNRELKENYLRTGLETTFGTTKDEKYSKTLGQTEYFVLGDNRDHSSDSRDWGILPKENIIGRAWLNIYPFEFRGIVKNPVYTF